MDNCCISKKNVLPLQLIHISNLQRDCIFLCKKAIKYDFWTQVEMHDADFALYEEGATLVVIK